MKIWFNLWILKLSHILKVHTLTEEKEKFIITRNQDMSERMLYEFNISNIIKK